MTTSLKDMQKLNALTPQVQKNADGYLAEWGGQFPSVAQWRKASSVLLANRSSDNVLTRIDQYVGLAQLGGASADRRVLLSFLYFMTDHWLKIAGVGTGAKAQTHLQAKEINTGRTAAVYALFIATVNTLCAELTAGLFGGAYGVTPNTLPEFLEQMFGRDLLTEKLKQDIWEGSAKYIDASDLVKYRLQFRNGLAYMTNWYEKSAKPKLVLANSSHAVPEGKHFYPETESDFGGFVMGMSREIYMNQHVTRGSGQHASFYHSSYFAGKGVLCAGTIKITNGRVVAISNGSGHYAPRTSELVTLINTLFMHGVAMRGVTVWVYPHRGVSVNEFIGGNFRGMLDGLDARMAEFVTHRGLIQRNEGAYLSLQRELDMLYAENTLYYNMSKWLKCQNTNSRAPKSGLDMPSCRCKYCNVEMEKPEWKKGESVWKEMKQRGLLNEQALAKLRGPIDARIKTLKESAP
jgi:hypothetical protein